MVYMITKVFDVFREFSVMKLKIFNFFSLIFDFKDEFGMKKVLLS